MYWQKKFAQPEVPDKREQIILAIRKEHKDYGYRRLWAHMRNPGYMINHKAVQRIVQKLELQVHSFTRKSRRYSSYRGTVGNIADNLLKRRFKTCIPHQKITTDTSLIVSVPIVGNGEYVLNNLAIGACDEAIVLILCNINTH